MDAQVTNKINYHTNQLKKSFRLNSHDTDDIRQDLALAAWQAKERHKESMNANQLTYVKSAIEKHAAYICRKLSGLPIIENHEDGGGIEGAGVRNRNFRRTTEIMDELNNANHAQTTETKKVKAKPTVASLGVNLQHVMEAKLESDPAARMDVQAVLSNLKPRQRKICQMLMTGHTLEEIAKAIGVRKQSIHVAIKRLQPIFEKTQLLD